MGLDAILDEFIAQEILPSTYTDSALKWFIPVAEKIAEHHNSAKGTILVGLNGSQGSGKSTLCALLCKVLSEHYKKPCLGMSIDDFYLSKMARKNKAKQIHPLFATRGVPGTHDTQLLLNTLQKLKQGLPTQISRFNKSTDDLYPNEQWRTVDKAIDVIILEGWCVGIGAQQETDLKDAVNSLEANKDPDGTWRKTVNMTLQKEYAEIFDLIDFHIMLQCPSFDTVYKWRCEQEHKLIAKLDKQNNQAAPSTTSSEYQKAKLAGIMSDEQIAEFIQYYERLTVHALNTMPSQSDIVFMLNKTREIVDCHYQ